MKLKWNQSHWSLNHNGSTAAGALRCLHVLCSQTAGECEEKKKFHCLTCFFLVCDVYIPRSLCDVTATVFCSQTALKSSVTAWLPVANKCSFSGGRRWRFWLQDSWEKKKCFRWFGFVMTWMMRKITIFGCYCYCYCCLFFFKKKKKYYGTPCIYLCTKSSCYNRN